MEENKTASDKLFPNTLSLIFTTGGLVWIVSSFTSGIAKNQKAMVFYGGCAMLGVGLIARAIGKAKEKKETIE